MFRSLICPFSCILSGSYCAIGRPWIQAIVDQRCGPPDEFARVVNALRLPGDAFESTEQSAGQQEERT